MSKEEQVGLEHESLFSQNPHVGTFNTKNETDMKKLSSVILSRNSIMLGSNSQVFSGLPTPAAAARRTWGKNINWKDLRGIFFIKQLRFVKLNLENVWTGLTLCTER